MTREELERDEANLIAQIQQATGALAYVRMQLKRMTDAAAKAAEKSDAETPKEA